MKYTVGISAIVLTKNEEAMIADCIDSLSFCDEIIVVDLQSIDKTIEIAKRMGAKTVLTNLESFSARRNLGAKTSKYKWILYVDADERVCKELQQEIITSVLSKKESPFSAYSIKRKNYYLGNFLWPQEEAFLRLFQKNKLLGWEGLLHETASVEGEVSTLDSYLVHYTHRDLEQMLNKTISWSQIEADLRLQANHPKMSWWRFPRVMMSAFFDSYIRQKGYKVGTAGFIESIYQSFSMFITYARLWELQQGKKTKGS